VNGEAGGGTGCFDKGKNGYSTNRGIARFRLRNFIRETEAFYVKIASIGCG